ncbi:MAG TPA: PA2169 family four-helix-bundle protein [Pyrinomonadaceae bacterium]|nr:PA2169 family four-helix-bundle protein [Pyrinomonadaceae bacterium]
MASNAEVIRTLNGLIETCRDGQEGFRTAAEGVQSSELKELFHSYSRQRASFVGELQDEVRRMGGEAEDSGSTTAALHRGWMGLKAALSGGDDRAVLAECERGEDAALSNYRAALGTDMPASARSMVERQFAEVKEAHERVRNLERADGAGA